MVTREQLLQREQVRTKILKYLVTFSQVRYSDLSISDATLDDCRELMKLGYMIVGPGKDPIITLTPEGKKKSGMKVGRKLVR